MPSPAAPNTVAPNVGLEMLETASKEVDRQLSADRQYPELTELLGVTSQNSVSFSGVNDYDYPCLSSPSVSLSGMELISPVKKVPLPAELVEQFDHMQCNCMMGLFPEIRRAWLTVDSDIFVWNYEDGSDLAYFDGLSETILCAGLVKPKPEILRDSVKYVLCLTTPVDIVLLAVTFTPRSRGALPEDGLAEMHLQPDPLFSIPSDNVYMTCVTGTILGRVFTGGKDGCVYEIAYQAKNSWFQGKCRKINHSSSLFSYLVPSFLSVSGEDPLCQLAVDNTRNILYSRSEKGTIQVFDLGADGCGMSYVASLTQDSIAHKAASATRTADYSNFKPIVHIAPVSQSESSYIQLVAITQAGVRLYFCTVPSREINGRPSRLNLVHIRMPPGFAPSATSLRPSQVHASFYRQGMTILSSAQTEDTDVLWAISSDPFPFQTPLKEMQVTIPLDGRTWAVSEVPDFSSNLVAPCPVLSDRWPEPPIVVKQHALPQRSFVVLSAQGSYLMSSYRPVEQLHELLITSQGFDSEAVQAFFKLHKKKTVITGTCHTFNSIKKTGKWRSKVNLSKYSKVLIPGQFDATNHWQLCVVDLDEGTIALVDPMSLETDMDSVVFNEMREFLEKREGNKSKVEWRQKWIAHPLQIDCISCGVFILKIAECLAWDMAISSTKEGQACAIALVLACSTQATDPQVADWATRAFFKYGGESQLLHQPLSGPGDIVSGPNSFGGSYISSPGQKSDVQPFGQSYVTSTPQPGVTGRAVFQPEVTKSGKHDGLCLYVARILGTLWDSRLAYEEFAVPPTPAYTQPPVVFRSRFTCEQLSWFLTKLRELQSWMEKNLQFVAPYQDSSFPHMTLTGGQQVLQRSHQATTEAYLAERRALTSLKHLVDRSYEVIGLWQIICESGFESSVDQMDPVQKDRMRYMKFKDLVINGHEVCSGLISALMNCYLEDSSSTDAISERLRQLCPSLYSSDDAVCTKAGELLTLAKKTVNKAEQTHLLKDALQCYRQVTHQINLELICSILESVRFYEGVVELALYAAHRRDPQGHALHFYKNGESPGDVQGQEAMIARHQCYKCITDCLQRLLAIRQSSAQSPSLPSRPGPPPTPDPNALTPIDAEKYMELTLTLALSSGDELWHVSLYQWLIDNALTDRLLEIKSVHLEAYLKHKTAAQFPNDLKMLDLLWRHYEKTKNYAAAARILSKLAERESGDVSLVQRLEYLSRAIMSAKSSNLRTSSSKEGEFLHELEEKLEVARIQSQVYEALSRRHASRPSPHLQDALNQLNNRLVDVTTLYGEYADLFSLAECKLAIVHCAGHYEPTLIETLWREIIDKELKESSSSSPSDRIALISSKMVALGRTYVHSERYFPLGALVLILERYSAELDWDPTWVFMTMLEIGIPFPVLHGIYDRMFKAKDPCWQAINKPLHVLEVIYHLLTKYLDTPSLMPPYERPAFTTTLYDACATYLVELESICSRDGTVQNTLAKYKGLQASLKRRL